MGSRPVDEIPAYIVKETLANPMDWSEGGRVHNWRNHVGHHTRAKWHSFTDEQKIAIAADADEKAGREHWD